jgi:SAM-dependent methyltransferase
VSEIATAKLSIDVRLLPDAPGIRVVDVGCGDGRHTRAAARLGLRTVGLDFDREELRRARLRGSSAIDYVQADAARLPFRDGAFGAAICTETLEHLPDDRAAIREIARVLECGAVLLGAVPSHFSELVYFRLSRGYRDAPGGHVRIYAPAVLFGRLRTAGFAVRGYRYLHFIDSLLWLRFCVVDALQLRRPRSDFEAAVMIAEAQERASAQKRTPAPWRRALRRAMSESRLVVAIDRAGAFVWPKSLAFVARKRR